MTRRDINHPQSGRRPHRDQRGRPGPVGVHARPVERAGRGLPLPVHHRPRLPALRGRGRQRRQVLLRPQRAARVRADLVLYADSAFAGAHDSGIIHCIHTLHDTYV